MHESNNYLTQLANRHTQTYTCVIPSNMLSHC